MDSVSLGRIIGFGTRGRLHGMRDMLDFGMPFADALNDLDPGKLDRSLSESPAPKLKAAVAVKKEWEMSKQRRKHNRLSRPRWPWEAVKGEDISATGPVDAQPGAS